MPLILIFGQIRGAYLGGSILAFFLGYSMLFFKGGILASIYPFSAALILVGFGHTILCILYNHFLVFLLIIDNHIL